MVEQDSSSKSTGLMLAGFCEFLGTFFLVVIGTGAIVMDRASSGAIGHVGISLCFGLVVCVVIYSMGHLSGAHINPAVSLGFFATGEISLIRLLIYVASQILGALAASCLLFLLFTREFGLGATLPNTNLPDTISPTTVCLALEFVLTFILMWVILAMTSTSNSHSNWTGLVVGAVIAMEAMAAGPICGASMNPARSLGPAVVGGQWQELWIYLLAPTAGALTASLLGPFCLGPRDRQLDELDRISDS